MELILIDTVQCKVHWKKTATNNGMTHSLFIGRVEIARYFLNPLAPRGSVLKYKAKTSMPTLSNNLGDFETEKECIDACLSAAILFCSNLKSY